MEVVRKHEHMPQLAALIAKYAEEHHNNTQLVRTSQLAQLSLAFVSNLAHRRHKQPDTQLT